MQLPSLFGIQNRFAFQFNLIWSRIIFSRLTLAYFLFSVVHCIVQVALQGQALSVNSKAASVLFSLIHEKNATCNGFMVLGDTLRLCSEVPSKLQVDSCEQIWPVPSHSAGSSNTEPETTSESLSSATINSQTFLSFTVTEASTQTTSSTSAQTSIIPTGTAPQASSQTRSSTTSTSSRTPTTGTTSSTSLAASTTTSTRPTAAPGGTDINIADESDSGDEFDSDSGDEDSVSGDSASSDSEDEAPVARRDVIQEAGEEEYFEDDDLLKELFEIDEPKVQSPQRRSLTSSSALAFPQATGLSLPVVPKAAVTSSPTSATAGADSDSGGSLSSGSDAPGNDSLSGESDNDSLSGASDDESVDDNASVSGDESDNESVDDLASLSGDESDNEVDNDASVSGDESDNESVDDDASISGDESDDDSVSEDDFFSSNSNGLGADRSVGDIKVKLASTASGASDATSPREIDARLLHHSERRQTQNSGVENEVSETVEPDQTCFTALNYPLMMIRYTEREDVAFIVFQVWVLGMSTVALLNESVPHVLASLLTHLASTGWSAYKLANTASFHTDFNSFINNGACGATDILRDYWAQRTRAEVPTLVLNVVFLAISAFMTWKLLKVFGWQTYKRMGASRSVNRLYMTVLTLSIVIQLSLYFMAVTLVVWLDQLSSGDIAKLSTSKTVYRALFIVSLVILIPWLCTGWLAVRRDAKLPMLIFLMISTWFVGGWGALFFASAFQWTFITWKFFAVMASLSVFLTGCAFVLALYCWRTFGSGLASDDFGAMGGDFAPVFPPVRDEEKIGFPPEHPLPTYSGVFDIHKV